MNGDRPSTNDGARQGLAWLAHPITLVALVVLLVNDHLLKAVWPGAVSGKLSDVAGLVLAPPLLATMVLLVLRRLPPEPVAVAAVALVGAGFTAVKTLPDAASWASSLWSVLGPPSRVRPDLTDLLTIPALALAWLAWRRSCDRPAPGTVTRAARLTVVLPLALLGVMATSAGYAHLEIATGVGPGVGGDAVILAGRDGVTAASADGISWRRVPGPSVRPSGQGPNYDPSALAAARRARSTACTSGTCYRVVRNALRIEQSSDGGATWTTAWSVDDARRERYAEILADDAKFDRDYAGDVHADLACRTIYTVPDSGVVIAACGLVGFVSRDDAGNWAMIGFMGDGSDVPRSDVYTTVDNANSLMILLFGWFVLVAGAEAYALTRRPRAACAARLTVAALVSLVCVPVMALPWIAPDIDDPFLRGLLVMPLLALGTAGWLLLYIKSHRSFNLWLVPLAIAAPVTGLVLQAERLGGTTGPMTGWVAVAGFATAALIANIALGVRLSRTRSNLDVTGR